MNKKEQLKIQKLNIFYFLAGMQDLFGNQNDVIRSLGLFQPYCSLMWTHDKLETRWVLRGKKPPFPKGKYMIYACKRAYTVPEVQSISGNYLDTAIWDHNLQYMLTGMPLLIADLVSVRDMEWDDQPKAFVALNQEVKGSRQVILEFHNKQRIKPFPFKGKQGVGILTPEQIAQIELI